MPETARKRYTIKTGYHYWQIIDNQTGNAVDSISARGRGDKAARGLARERCDSLNRKEEDK